MFFNDFFVSVRNDLTFINSVKIGKDPPENVNVIIEIPKGSNIKYEIDIESGLLLVDRKLPTSMVYPFNYGFIPMTRESVMEIQLTFLYLEIIPCCQCP